MSSQEQKQPKNIRKRWWAKYNLKSVDGSFPCHPISFHWSEIKPWSSWLGNEVDHRALKASCPWKNLWMSGFNMKAKKMGMNVKKFQYC